MSTPNKRRDVVLIVDDSPETLSMLNDTLDQAGVTVLVALEGAQAITIASSVFPDVILMDAIMPNMDGFETCRRLKANHALSHIPVIFMTGLSEPESVVKGFEAGGIDYITKPVEPESLQRVLSQWLAADQRKQNVPMEGVIKLAEGNQSTDAWDAEKLMNKVNRREKHFNLVVSAFKESTPEKISELKRAMAQADFATAATIAHTLKGAAASLCAPRLQKMMFNVEQQANNKTSSAWPDLIPVIDTEFSILMKQLGKDAAQEPAAAS